MELMENALASLQKARGQALSKIPDDKPFHKIAMHFYFDVWKEEIRNPGFGERIKEFGKREKLWRQQFESRSLSKAANSNLPASKSKKRGSKPSTSPLNF